MKHILKEYILPLIIGLTIIAVGSWLACILIPDLEMGDMEEVYVPDDIFAPTYTVENKLKGTCNYLDLHRVYYDYTKVKPVIKEGYIEFVDIPKEAVK